MRLPAIPLDQGCIQCVTLIFITCYNIQQHVSIDPKCYGLYTDILGKQKIFPTQTWFWMRFIHLRCIQI